MDMTVPNQGLFANVSVFLSFVFSLHKSFQCVRIEVNEGRIIFAIIPRILFQLISEFTSGNVKKGSNQTKPIASKHFYQKGPTHL